MAKTAAEIIQSAVDRARGRSALVHFVGVEAGHAVYAVGSSADVDVAYTVEVDGDAVTCTCPAAARSACWHRGAVVGVRFSRAAHGLPADGLSAHDLAAAERVAAARARIDEIGRMFAA